MNNEVRKPQDWWIYEQYNQAADLGIIRMATKERFSKENREQFSETHCKEILPGDDSIRVSREDFNILLKEIKIIKRKNGPAENSSHNVTFVENLLESIERESKGE